MLESKWSMVSGEWGHYFSIWQGHRTRARSEWPERWHSCRLLFRHIFLWAIKYFLLEIIIELYIHSLHT